MLLEERKNEQHHMLAYTEEDKQTLKKELGIKDSEIEDDIDAILEWFQKQPHLAEAFIDRDIIEKILVISKGSREKTKSRINNFYKYRSLAPQLVKSRIDLLTNSKDNIWTFTKQALIPKLYNGKRISIISFDSDPTSFDTETLYRNIILSADLRLKFDYVFSEIWIVDLKNIGIGHLLRLNPLIAQRAASMYQDGIGLRIHQIHCVNAHSFGQNVLNLMKRFTKQKIIERVNIHESQESLHKFIPKEYLLEDYGGDHPSLEEFTDKMNKEFRSERILKSMVNYCTLVSDESKRVTDTYDGECIGGSFKKLDFD